MKVGFYKTGMGDPINFYDVDSDDVIEEVATDFANEEHQIDEASDMNFSVYVEDDSGAIHEVKFYTEYDPRFEVEAVSKLGT